MVGRVKSTVQSSREAEWPRRAFLASLAVLLLGCGSDPQSARDSPRDVSASAFFRDSEDTIEARGFGRWPLQQAELVAPDGAVYLALDIRNDRTAGADPGLRPSVGIGGSGGSRSGADVGVGISIPILGGGGMPPSIASRASFPVIDMPGYRATWKLWVVRMQFAGADGRPRYVEVPAPEPPSRSDRSR